MKTKLLLVTRTVELSKSILVEVPETLTPDVLENVIQDECEVFDHLDESWLGRMDLDKDPRDIMTEGSEFSVSTPTEKDLVDVEKKKKLGRVCTFVRRDGEKPWLEALEAEAIGPI